MIPPWLERVDQIATSSRSRSWRPITIFSSYLKIGGCRSQSVVVILDGLGWTLRRKRSAESSSRDKRSRGLDVAHSQRIKTHSNIGPAPLGIEPNMTKYTGNTQFPRKFSTARYARATWVLRWGGFATVLYAFLLSESPKYRAVWVWRGSNWPDWLESASCCS